MKRRSKKKVAKKTAKKKKTTKKATKKRGGAKTHPSTKGRTRREVLRGDFRDTTYCTSLDWPADVYVLAKAVAEARGVAMNELAFEAMRVYLLQCPELSGLNLKDK